VGNTKLAALRGVRAFEGLDRSHLETLARLAIRRSHAAGATIFSEGDTSGGLHVVRTGRVRVYKLGPEGKEQILHIWGPGEPFGEAAAFEDVPYPAHAEAIEATTTLFIPRAGLIEEVRRDPDFALALVTLLSRRLRRLAGLVESLSLREVPGRLAAFLLLLSERQGNIDRVSLDIPKAQLAAVIGTIPETLSRILGRLAREGIAATDGPRSIVLRDRDALRALAEGTRRLG
jgi:CRP/FNR family transcriptional regulator, dissimilatory nitrate respiration regulator